MIIFTCLVFDSHKILIILFHASSIHPFINNDFFEVAPLETEDYITAACPELMGSLAPAIFGLLLGKINTDVAIEYVKKEILHEAN